MDMKEADKQKLLDGLRRAIEHKASYGTLNNYPYQSEDEKATMYLIKAAQALAKILEADINGTAKMVPLGTATPAMLIHILEVFGENFMDLEEDQLEMYSDSMIDAIKAAPDLLGEILEGEG